MGVLIDLIGKKYEYRKTTLVNLSKWLLSCVYYCNFFFKIRLIHILKIVLKTLFIFSIMWWPFLKYHKLKQDLGSVNLTLCQTAVWRIPPISPVFFIALTVWCGCWFKCRFVPSVQLCSFHDRDSQLILNLKCFSVLLCDHLMHH